MDERDSGVTLAELLAAFSLATDLGLGQPMEHLLRSWQIASRLGRLVGLPDDQQPTLFHVAMLSWVGCVADAPEVTASFGDDIVFRADSYQADLGGLSGMAFFLGHAGRGQPLPQRLRVAATMVATGGTRVMRGIQGHCLVTSTLADQLGLPEETSAAVRQFFARWDGQGVPRGVRGEQIALVVRLFHLADVVEVHHRRGGVSAAVEVARARSGSQFDPRLVEAFCSTAVEVLPVATDEYDAHQLFSRDPGLTCRLSDDDLDAALVALADFTDLRCPTRAGHSRGVADLSAEAARRLRLPAGEVTMVYRAGLVHDVGLHGVPTTILDKPTPLTATEEERLRAASYFTERVLSRPKALARLGAIAGLAHERMDGSGYHRGVGGQAVPLPGRILAAACAFHELVEPRSSRPARTLKEATGVIRAEIAAGRLDQAAADAVLAAAGAGTRRRVAGPAGLTPRELEVLGLIARGAATGDVASRLGISRKTAGTHIERIYAKTGASSRSTATLFALRSGLLGALDDRPDSHVAP
ncbi:HD domain-containing protein [Nocardioides koreensis]|uniref:HD domain-containing protein n=1 Tax=Nocardioides koreensis TaxID=433651 RepID=A0ABP5LXQ8_9ACTN